MTVRALALKDFRNLSEASLELAAGINLLVGPNGAGKTSVLEAIYYLGRGRSFRSGRRDRLIRAGSEGFRIVARVDTGGRSRHVGCERGRGGEQRLRLDGGEAEGWAELARIVPAQVVHPSSHRLIEEGPEHRRRYMDWGVFHVEPRFYEGYRRYRRALAQRNQVLRRLGKKAELLAWTPELTRTAEELTAWRRRYVQRLEACLVEEMGVLWPGLQPRLRLRPGWKGEDLGAALAATLERDREQGYTTAGPHRADLQIELDEGVLARDRLSRGQQKLLVFALCLAQARLTRQQATSVLLLDDLSAELDAERLTRSWHRIEELGVQALVTAVEAPPLPAPALFHVEQGRIHREQ